MEKVNLIPQIVIVACAVTAGVIDARTFRIPNLLTIPVLLSGFIYHGVTGGFAGLQASFAGAFFGFAVIFVMFIVGGMGAGDVKLMAAIGAWLQMQTTVYVFVIAAFMMGLYSVVMLIRQKRLRDGIKTVKITWFQLISIGKHLGREDCVEDMHNRGDSRSRFIPFATLIMLSVIMVMIWISWIQ
ncbi:MAG: A24 family peptidase [Thermoguttaceae bacterium]